MMRRTERNQTTAAHGQLLSKLLLSAATLMLACGCRNTTTTAPGTPLGATAPLAPYPGNPSLTPVPGTTGLGNLGQPTRVPPPPTGSYTAPTPGAPAPVSTWGNPAPGTLAPTSLPPSGSTIGTTGMTRGVTNLTPAPVGVPNSGVQQTGWVGDSPAPVSTGAPATVGVPPSAVPSPTAGGMQVIDLTGSPSPPGYQPATGGYAQPAPVNYGQPATYPPSIPAAGTPASYSGVPPTGVTTVGAPTAVTASQPTSGNAFESNAAVQSFSPPATVAFPSTQPYPDTTATDSLQWRSPSPRY